MRLFNLTLQKLFGRLLPFLLWLIIPQSIPATRQLLQDSVMADLTGWLVGIREKSTDIGEIAFRQTERKRDEWRRISENDSVLSNASFNSALERVFDEQDDCTSTSVGLC